MFGYNEYLDIMPSSCFTEPFERKKYRLYNRPVKLGNFTGMKRGLSSLPLFYSFFFFFYFFTICVFDIIGIKIKNWKRLDQSCYKIFTIHN